MKHTTKRKEIYRPTPHELFAALAIRDCVDADQAGQTLQALILDEKNHIRMTPQARRAFNQATCATLTKFIVDHCTGRKPANYTL